MAEAFAIPRKALNPLMFRHPKELCSLGVLLRIVSGEGWGRRRFQEEEGAGEEMEPETPPPFACRKVAGGSHGRPRTGTRPRARGGLPPGSRPVSGRPPPGRPRVKGWSPSGATWDHPVPQMSTSRPTPVVKRNKNHVSQKVAF